jgi:hypothetical protein
LQAKGREGLGGEDAMRETRNALERIFEIFIMLLLPLALLFVPLEPLREVDGAQLLNPIWLAIVLLLISAGVLGVLAACSNDRRV